MEQNREINLNNLKKYHLLKKSLAKKVVKLEEGFKKIQKLQNQYDSSQTLLVETLNVKLRYEQIIQNLINNEKDGNKSSTIKVIASTKPTTQVTLAQLGKTNRVQKIVSEPVD